MLMSETASIKTLAPAMCAADGGFRIVRRVFFLTYLQLDGLPADGPASHSTPSEAGPGRTMAIAALVAGALCLAACPAASFASETDPLLSAQGPPPVARSDASGPVEGGPVEGGAQGSGAAQIAPMSTMSHAQTLGRLEAAILRMEGEIAELARLSDWQARLLSAARTDPVGARRQRRPYASCLETPLAAWCDRLNGMYRDVEGGRAAREDDGVQDRRAER